MLKRISHLEMQLRFPKYFYSFHHTSTFRLMYPSQYIRPFSSFHAFSIHVKTLSASETSRNHTWKHKITFLRCLPTPIFSISAHAINRLFVEALLTLDSDQDTKKGWTFALSTCSRLLCLSFIHHQIQQSPFVVTIDEFDGSSPLRELHSPSSS